MQPPGGGTTYRVYVNRAAGLAFFPAIDEFPLNGLECALASATTYNYLQVLDELGGTKYVYLETTGGSTTFVVSTSSPGGTAHVGSPILRGVRTPRQFYTIGATSFLQVNIQTVL